MTIVPVYCVLSFMSLRTPPLPPATGTRCRPSSVIQAWQANPSKLMASRWWCFCTAHSLHIPPSIILMSTVSSLNRHHTHSMRLVWRPLKINWLEFICFIFMFLHTYGWNIVEILILLLILHFIALFSYLLP